MPCGWPGDVSLLELQQLYKTQDIRALQRVPLLTRVLGLAQGGDLTRDSVLDPRE